MPTMKRSLASAVVVLGVATGFGAGAQTTPAPAAPAAPRTATAMPPAAKDTATRHVPAATRVEGQITQLRKQLRITDAQAPQWTAFAEVMRENAEHMDTLYAQRMKGAAGRTAIDDMSSYAELAKAHADDVQRLVPPFAALYAAMSDDQKKAADAVFQRAEGRTAPRGGPGHG